MPNAATEPLPVSNDFALATTIGELRGRVAAVEDRLGRGEATAVRIETKIDQLRTELNEAASAVRIGAWLADASRMGIASVVAAVAGWLLARGHLPL